jgi:hypothetical protein
MHSNECCNEYHYGDIAHYPLYVMYLTVVDLRTLSGCRSHNMASLGSVIGDHRLAGSLVAKS